MFPKFCNIAHNVLRFPPYFPKSFLKFTSIKLQSSGRIRFVLQNFFNLFLDFIKSRRQFPLVL